MQLQKIDFRLLIYTPKNIYCILKKEKKKELETWE